ncbi:MAG: peptidylprolyl isomerase [Massiliimalia sp.]|jgi:peptidyl-prolyl cis-trans isomerase B (cyclophilin B)
MRKVAKMFAVLTVGLFVLTGCMPAGTRPPSQDINLVQFETPADDQEMAVVETNYGTIKFVLYEEYAPETVKQFKQLVEEGFYENNPIYAVDHTATAMLAGATDSEGEEGKTTTKDGKGIKTETSSDLWHFPGAVSALGEETGITKSIRSDSRFFIIGNSSADAETLEQMEESNYPETVISAYKEHGGQPLYTGQYTIFGQVVEGLDVVDQIIQVPTQKDENGEDTFTPSEELVIYSITLTTYGEGMNQSQTQE